MIARWVANALTFAALALGLLTGDAQAKTRRRPAFVGSGGASYTTPAVLDGTSFPGVRFWFAPWYAEHSWQEYDASATPAVTQVTADAQSFGYYQDPVFGRIVLTPSAARRGVSGTLNGQAYYECSATGSNDQLTLPDSEDMFRSFHTDRLGTIAMLIDPVTADGTSFYFGENNNSTGTMRGFHVLRNVGNTMTFAITNATTTICTVTTVATIVAGNASLVPVVLRADGTNVTIDINGTVATAACTGAGSAGSSGQTFRFCGRSTGNASMRLGEVVIADQHWSDAQVDAWTAQAGGARTTEPIAYTRSAENGRWPFLRLWYDFRDVDTLWEDAGATDQVEAAADEIHVVRDVRDLTNYLRVQATSVGATHPTYVSATEGIDFADRISDELLWSSHITPYAGARTIYSLNDCDDTVNGCRMLYASASSYFVRTAEDYVGNTDPSGCGYKLGHLTTGTAGTVAGCSTVPENGRVCFVWRREGSTHRIGSVGGTYEDATNATAFHPVSIGNSSSADWIMDGTYQGLREYSTAVPESMDATICADMGL